MAITRLYTLNVSAFQGGRHVHNHERPVRVLHGRGGEPELRLRASPGGDQFERQIPRAKGQFDTDVAGDSSTLSIENEASSTVPLFPS